MPAWLYFDRASNMAYHNLLINKKQLPPGTQSLLGLGLGFCPAPRLSTRANDVDLDRFDANLKLRMFFDDDNDNDNTRMIPKLYVRSNWKPHPREFYPEFLDRISSFCSAVRNTLATRRKVRNNLLPMQRVALENIRKNHNLHVFKTDKNLGPAIIEKEVYIRRALDDHLLDTNTYGELHEFAADEWMSELRTEINNKIISRLPKGNEKTFLQRSLAKVVDPYAYFYLLAKVHKTPWKTRPIISVSGSLLHGLGKWVDHCLQNIIDTLPYVCRSSYHLVQELAALTIPSNNTRLFTMDAVSMYTNIETDHALTVIGTYLRSPNTAAMLLNKNISPDLLLEALTIIMRNNVFKFGDTYWYQKTGTAMGTPPAPPYATLYFAIHEMNIIPQFPNLVFYRRLIDDGFGIWIGDDKDTEFAEFQRKINNYGKLTWEFSEFQTSVNFLDLTISTNISSPTNSNIQYKLFEKALNLYLYLPPNSAHPPGILKGLIYGMVLRMHRLTSDKSSLTSNVIALYRRLRQRGYSPAVLRPIFLSAVFRSDKKQEQTKSTAKLLFLHLPFNPADPPASTWRHLFHKEIGEPRDRIPLSQLCGRYGSRRRFGAHRFIVAYSRQPSLGNILSPRRLRANTSIASFTFKKGGANSSVNL